MASYPSSKKVFVQRVDQTVLYATDVNQAYDEIVAMQGILGINPHISTDGSGSFTQAATTFPTVSARLANLEAGFKSATFDLKYIKRTGETSIFDMTAVTGTMSGGSTGIGDKIALWSSSYGFGVQSSRLVAYVDAGAGFAVRAVNPGAGNRSANGDAHVFLANGDATHTGTLTVNNLLSVTNGITSGKWLQAAFGAGNGFRFPADSFGGSGDAAAIELLNPLGGEATELTVVITNDGDDRFTVKTTGGQYWRNPTGNAVVAFMTFDGKLRLGDAATPGERLEVNGNAVVTGRVTSATQTVSGLATLGALNAGVTNVSSGGSALQLLASTADHTYLSFFARTATLGVRSGWMGYGSTGTTTMSVTNEIGPIQLNATGVATTGAFTVGTSAIISNALTVQGSSTFNQRSNHNAGLTTLNEYVTNETSAYTVIARGGNSAGAFNQDSMLFSFSNSNSYKHGIRTRHHAGQTTDNAFEFYLWNFGVDADQASPTRRAFTIDAAFAQAHYDFRVTGASTFTGNVTTNGTLVVQGGASFNSAATFNGQVTANGGYVSKGDILIDSPSRRTLYPINTDLGFQVRSNGGGTLQLNADNAGPVSIAQGGGLTTVHGAFTNTGVARFNGGTGTSGSTNITLTRSTGGQMANFTNGTDADLFFVLSAANAADKFSLIAPSTSTRLAFGTALTERMSLDNDNNLRVGNGSSTGRVFFGGAVLRPDGGTYGSFRVDGSRNTWAGINFGLTNRTLMMGTAGNPGISGVHNDNNTWDWYFQDGVLTVGTVPFARTSGVVGTTTDQGIAGIKTFNAVTNFQAAPNLNAGANVTGGSNIVFTGGTEKYIQFESGINPSSDRGFLWWQDDSAFVEFAQSNENGRLTLGVVNDGPTTANDELWFQGANRIVHNAGSMDAETTAKWGLVSNSSSFPHVWQANNSPMMRLRNDGLLALTNVRNYADNGPYVNFPDANNSYLRSNGGTAQLEWGTNNVRSLVGHSFQSRAFINGTTGTSYTAAGLEIFNSGSSVSPRISFHMGGIVASQFGMGSNGALRTFNNPGTGYEAFEAAGITSFSGYVASTSGANPQYYLGTAASAVNLAMASSSGSWANAATAGSFVARTNAAGARIVFAAGVGGSNTNNVVITDKGSILAGANGSVGGYDVVLHSIMNR